MQNHFDFDSIHNRRAFNSSKWVKYGDRDILPFWVADMDFASPRFLLEAVEERMKHPVLGYTEVTEQLDAAVVSWLARRYDWDVNADWLVWVSAIVPGMNVAVRCLGKPGEKCVVIVPIYPPFLNMPGNGFKVLETSRSQQVGGRWEMDFDDLRRKTRGASSLLLSNPQNPTGRVYTDDELRSLAEICLENDVLILSDEIHWGLVLEPGCVHRPIASLSPEIANQTITFFSHTKTYNVAGLQSAVAIIPNETVRESFETARKGVAHSISPLALAATLAAYNDETTWIPEVQDYLRRNRDLLQDEVRKTEVLSMSNVEGTHLGWIDARAIPVKDHAAYFEAFGLGLSDGVEFMGDGFLRFNFAAPTKLVKAGLERLSLAAKHVCG